MHRRERKGAAEQTVASVSPPTLAVPASLHASPMARLDRLARNVAFVSRLMESGIEFVAAEHAPMFADKLHHFTFSPPWLSTNAAKARGVAKLGGPKAKASATSRHRLQQQCAPRH